MVVDPTNLEQHPLLMVSGAGDATVRRPPPVIDSLIWNAPAQPRRAWSDRWPEYLSTCWMTLVLLAISFLIFYSIGMVVVYRQEGNLINVNETKQTNEVFYHAMVPRSAPLPLFKYADYLGNVATLYPNLKFNVYFLIDDSQPAELSFIDKIYKYATFSESFNINNNRDARSFQKRYPNINISVKFLSQYMATTPLKYKWRNIPASYILFYARTFAVWMNGGLGLDLVKHNQLYHSLNHRNIERKARTILKQHNDGISPEQYILALKKLERDEETECLSSFLEMVQNILFETVQMFNKAVTFDSTTNSKLKEPVTPLMFKSKSLIRTHRSKRDIFDEGKENKTNFNNTSLSDIVNIVLDNSVAVNETSDSGKQNIYRIEASKQNESAKVTDYKPTISDVVLNEYGLHFEMPNQSLTEIIPEEVTHASKKNKSDGPQVVFFYDFSIFPADPKRSDIDPNKYGSPFKIVTIDSEGALIASTWRLHPFLGHILYSGCKLWSPNSAIKEALLNQCSGSFKDEQYCNSIFVL